MLFGPNVVCSETEERICQEEIGDEEYFKWACKNCEKKKSPAIHPWVYHLLDLQRLIKGGYRFEKNDLHEQTWIDLGILAEITEAIRSTRRFF